MDRSRDRWTVFVVPSSHNDIGWAGTPAEVADHRVKIIDSALRLVEDPSFGYRFSMETALYLREYLDRKPENSFLLEEHLARGHLEWGASYVQTYEGLQTEEGLLRQFALGIRMTEEAVGYRAEGYWNVDVVARSLQLPQVLRHVGVGYMTLSRNRPGLYWWEAPDGSRELTFNYWEGAYGRAKIFDSWKHHLSPLESGQAHAGAEQVLPGLEAVKAALENLADEWEKRLDDYGLPHGLAVVLAADYTVPDASIVELLQRFNQASPGPGREFELRLSTVREYLDWVKGRSQLDRLPVERGEVPNPWVYQQPGHWEVVANLRRGQQALLAAEALWSLLCLRAGEWSRYPSERLRAAWEDALYPDHGYGGLHGEGTDTVFHDRVNRGYFSGRGLVLAGLAELAAGAELAPGAGGREEGIDEVVVFNPNSWPISDWVDVTPRSLSFDQAPSGPARLGVEDAAGRAVEHQVVAGGAPGTRVGFLASSVPALGYTRYYLRRDAGDAASHGQGGGSPVRSAGEDIVWDAGGVMARVTGGGLAELRVDGVPLLSTDRYLGGEVLQLSSPGVDVGTHEHDDEYDWRIVRPFQPEVDGAVRPVAGRAELVESGPVRWVVRCRSEHRQCVLDQQITFYLAMPRVDLQVSVVGWTGEHSRELRWVFPLAREARRIRYGVPFGHATLGEDEVPEFRDVRPREFLRWLLADLGTATFALSSPVSTFDWLEPTRPASEGTFVQLVLLATKRSIHPRGNWYSQEGSHTFTASIHPRAVSPAEIEREARADGSLWAAVPTGAARRGSQVATSPSCEALVSDLQPSHVVATAVKKQEGGPALVVRLVETAGAPASVHLRTSFPVSAVASLDGCEARPGADVGARLGAPDEVMLSMRGHQIVTLALTPATAGHEGPMQP